jgi:hypothetical protein
MNDIAKPEGAEPVAWGAAGKAIKALRERQRTALPAADAGAGSDGALRDYDHDAAHRLDDLLRAYHKWISSTGGLADRAHGEYQETFRKLVDWIDSLRATPDVEREWHPIETAPKDGSYILVSNGAYIDVARWSHGSFGGFAKDGDCLFWQPLPPPPRTSAPADGGA